MKILLTYLYFIVKFGDLRAGISLIKIHAFSFFCQCPGRGYFETKFPVFKQIF